jgi:hypothetical protein
MRGRRRKERRHTIAWALGSAGLGSEKTPTSPSSRPTAAAAAAAEGDPMCHALVPLREERGMDLHGAAVCPEF